MARNLLEFTNFKKIRFFPVKIEVIQRIVIEAVYMSQVCRASPFKRGARFHYNFLLKIILLYMQTGLARLGGISLDSNGAPGQPGLNLSM